MRRVVTASSRPLRCSPDVAATTIELRRREASTASAPSPTWRPRSIRPAPGGLAGGASDRRVDRRAGCAKPGSRACTIQSPWENVRRHDPGLGARNGRGRRPLRHEGHPGLRRRQRRRLRGRGAARAGARRCRGRCPGPSVQLVAFDAEEARDDRDFEDRRHARQPPVRRLRPARAAGRGPPPLDEIRRDGALRHGRRLRPADPARGRTPTLRSTACSRTRRRADGRPAPFGGRTLRDRRRPHPVPRGGRAGAST